MRKTLIFMLFCLASVSLISAACDDSPEEKDSVLDHELESDDDLVSDTELDAEGPDQGDEREDELHVAPHWSYEGSTGPDFWGELSEEWTQCGAGTQQSPIALSSTLAAARHPELAFSYRQSAVEIENNGHSIRLNMEDGGEFEYDGKRYELEHLHFHAQSEHTLDGEHFAMEMHLVHKGQNGEVAVIGVFLEAAPELVPGDTGPYATIFESMPVEEGEAKPLDGVSIDAAALLPTEHAYWHYGGSLTTPPCTEGVNWFVMWEPVQLAESQVLAFQALYAHNFRPTQPLGERHVMGAHFGYSGELGAEHWGELSPQWETCGSGTEQSPIDFDAELPLLDLSESLLPNYAPTPLEVLNNGHTIQVNVEPGSTLALDGVDYDLLQFHFHAQSEHRLGGEPYPMELHLVHRNALGQLAVLGVFMQSSPETAENAALAPLWAHLPAQESGPQRIDGVEVNPAELLPADPLGWRYHGSLTTPPCTEGVSWSVLATPLDLSELQREQFTAIFDNNARPTQPLNERSVNP